MWSDLKRESDQLATFLHAYGQYSATRNTHPSPPVPAKRGLCPSEAMAAAAESSWNTGRSSWKEIFRELTR